MTFDFAPNWLDTVSADADTQPTHRALLSPAPLVAFAPARPPAPPTMAEVADLVDELFTEGSLSFEQLCSLSNAPELGALLEDKVANVAPIRRVANARR